MTCVGVIEDHQAVHLAGEADAAHLGAGDSGLRERAANRLTSGIPPVLGALLGPQRPLHPHIFVGRRVSTGAPVLVRPPAARACRPCLHRFPSTWL